MVFSQKYTDMIEAFDMRPGNCISQGFPLTGPSTSLRLYMAMYLVKQTETHVFVRLLFLFFLLCWLFFFLGLCDTS